MSPTRVAPLARREVGSRTGRISLLVLLVAVAARGAEAAFRVEKATFKVNMPASIKGTYDMSIANFGSPIYGATLTCVQPLPLGDLARSRLT